MIYYDYRSVQNDAGQRIPEPQRLSREREAHEHPGRAERESPADARPNKNLLERILGEKPVEGVPGKGLIGKDPDMESILLIGLVALLISEGADFSLIASLLYII